MSAIFSLSLFFFFCLCDRLTGINVFTIEQSTEHVQEKYNVLTTLRTDFFLLFQCP